MHQSNQVKKITCHQVWQAFIQETICSVATIRSVAAASSYSLILPDNLGIEEVTKEAFFVLGHNGLISAANQTGQLPEGKLGKGYIRKSKFPMALPFFFVKKKDGKL